MNKDKLEWPKEKVDIFQMEDTRECLVLESRKSSQSLVDSGNERAPVGTSFFHVCYVWKKEEERGESKKMYAFFIDFTSAA